VYRDMEQWTAIRRRVLVEGVSKRQILRETGMHWTTLEKILSESQPPGYCQKSPRRKPKLEPFLGRIEAILEGDKSVPKKQRHTAKRIYERLREEGYTGGYTQVKTAVRELRQHKREVFVPLSHPPGEAQVDFGWALFKVRGHLRKLPFFVMALPYSDAFFVQVFERECRETFAEGHVRAFEFFGGVPNRITYDNLSLAVTRILTGRGRRLTESFLQLKSHYLFDHHFCRVARGNEKGVVEGLVKYTRLNYFVPVPDVRNLEDLNLRLEERCREELSRRLRGKSATKGELLVEESGAFLALPAVPFEACRKASTAASSLSLVRFDGNDYSVPTRWAHHTIVAKGTVDRVLLSYKDQVVAEHPRCWEKGRTLFDPVHYLAVLERKPGALEHARPLEDWSLPDCYDTLRRRLERDDETNGRKEYIKVLRLLETHSEPAVTRAVEKALLLSHPIRDVVAQFLYPREEWRETTFRLDGREHLRGVRIDGPDIGAYASLLTGRGDS